MGTLFLWMRVPAISARYQTALIISGLVTFIAAYHYVRIFNSWTEAYKYSLDKADPQKCTWVGLDDHLGLSWRAHRGGGPLYPLELLVLCHGSFLLHRLRALGGPRRSHGLGERPKGARVDPPSSVDHRAELVDLPSRLPLPHARLCGGFGGCAHPGGVLRLRRHLKVRRWTPHLQHHSRQVPV